jgi:hypothetical protein
VHLVVNSPHAPGWSIALDDHPVAVTVLPRSGFMSLEVPSGSHRVNATFGRTPVRLAAEAWTAVSVAIWCALACWSAWSSWRHRGLTRRDLPGSVPV